MADWSELKRLAEAAKAEGEWFVEGGSIYSYYDKPDADFMVAASPDAILALLDEVESLRGLYLMHKETEERQMIELRSERDQIRAEVDGLQRQVDTLAEWYANGLNVIAECSAVLPGALYMDPPDGGDVSVPEQLRRMAKDAERYRWSISGDQEAETLISIVHCHGGYAEKISERVDVYMEAAKESSANG